jgi:hypothetical protein
MSDAVYDRQYYAERKKEPIAHAIWLEQHNARRRTRRLKRQDQNIEDAAKRMASLTEHPNFWVDFIQFATIALYPERLVPKNAK